MLIIPIDTRVEVEKVSLPMGAKGKARSSSIRQKLSAGSGPWIKGLGMAKAKRGIDPNNDGGVT